MDERDEITTLGRFARGQWPVVLAAVVVTTALAVWLAAARAPEPVWVATSRVRVSTNVANIANAPTVDTLVAAATQPQTLRLAATSLGLGPSALTGKVSAAIDSKNRSVADISVRDADKDLAAAKADAVAIAVREKALEPLRILIGFQNANADSLEERIPVLESALSDLQRRLRSSSLTDVERAGFEQTVLETRVQIYAYEDLARQARYTADLTTNYVVSDGIASVVRVADTGRLLSAGLRGLIVGLIAGMLAALVRERTTRGRLGT